MPAHAPKLKTFSRLADGRRVPSEYEIVSSQLHYHFPNSFELSDDNPVSAWVYKYREGAEVKCENWEKFADPRRTTYRGYNGLQDDKETLVDGLLAEIDDSGYDDKLSAEWIDFLHHWYGPLRYAAHGLEMHSAYLGTMAPASRVTNCCAFQAADEMRRLQRIAYRSVQLNQHRGGVDPAAHRGFWEDAEAFQPLRKLIEEALVVYDWGQSFAILDLVIKPRIDPLINEQFAGALAAANGGTILREIHYSFNEDAKWHRAWASDLCRMIVSDTPANAELLQGYVDKWTPAADEAINALAGVLSDAPNGIESAASAISQAAGERVTEVLAAPVAA